MTIYRLGSREGKRHLKSRLRVKNTGSGDTIGELTQKSFQPGQLVMLRDTTPHTGKLVPLWKGPYVISGYGGEHSTSYTLTKLDGRPAKNTYHGDHLREFRPREGYLVPPREEAIEIYTRMRHKRDEVRLRA